MQRWTLIGLSLTFVFFTTACSTKSISPAMNGNPGVTYGVNNSGHPTIEKIELNYRTELNNYAIETCITRGVEQPVNNPTVISGIWQITAMGSMVWDGGGINSIPFRYNLRVAPENGTTYTFDRLYYSSSGTSSASPLLASRWWSPQHAYTAIVDIAERIDQCLIYYEKPYQ